MKDINLTYSGVDYRIYRGFNGFASTISAQDCITQFIIKELFTEAGSNYYNPSLGTSFASIIGRSMTTADMELAKTILIQSISKIERSLLDYQAGQPDLQDYELVESITVNSINYNKAESSWLIYLVVKMRNNSTFTVRT